MRHAAGATDGTDQKHETDKGVIARSLSGALRYHPARKAIREQLLAHADEADWVTDRDRCWFSATRARRDRQAAAH